MTSIRLKVKAKELQGKEQEHRLCDKSTSQLSHSASPAENRCEQTVNKNDNKDVKQHFDESSESRLPDSWVEIQEVIESDFLISPADIYPSRKVELQDAEVSKETLEKFEQLCMDQRAAFSQNNRDIGKTQLIEMEIDTGGSVQLAWSPYTLPLKHYDWVRKEIETLEKAGVIEQSLSPWPSPVIVVPKKSTPDEHPRITGK